MNDIGTHLAAMAAIEGIGNVTIFRLISALTKHECGWDELWVSNTTKLQLLGLNEKQISSINTFKKEHTPYSYQEWLKFREINIITYLDLDYPKLLLTSDNFPAVLFLKGKKMELNNGPIIAVVGSRNMTKYGKQVTETLVTQLVNCGAHIVSGFMYGIDCTAHQVCLAVKGKTTGVLGYGFGYVYPVTQTRLMQEWIDQGMTFISPFAPHVAPRKGNFPARNRIVAGMSHAVVVVEAAEQSGSLITAGYAAQEGKAVCAVPGPITNPYTYGTRELLNQGALLVGSANDILTEVESIYPELRI